MTDEEMFYAWLDGELDLAEAATVEARVAADPVLAGLADRHRALGSRLRTSFDTVVEAPVPRSIGGALKPGGKVINIAEARSARDNRRATPVWGQFAAMAATLALGIGLGTAIKGESSSTPVEVRDGKIYAAAKLDDALNTQLASANKAGDVRIGITFRESTGSICRSFSNTTTSGLACREREGWQVRGLFGVPEGQISDYRMAAGGNPPLAALIDSSIAGDAFDSTQETAARNKGWR